MALTSKRFIVPQRTGDDQHDIAALAKAIVDYLQSLEDKQSLTLSNATGLNGTPVGDKDASTGKFTTLEGTTSFTTPALTVSTSSVFPSGSSTPTVTSQGGTLGTTSASLQWWKIGAYTYFDARVTVTTVGTGTGFVGFTLPSTPSADGTGSGVEFAVNAKQVSLTIISADSRARISNYDASSPIVAGASFQVSGRFKS